MKNRSKHSVPAKLAQGCKRFESWRNQQQHRSRLPEPLWSLATELAREFGVSRTARTLGLGYNCLKKRMETPVSDDTLQPSPQPQFLELLPAQANLDTECVIECENAQGTKMRIHLKGQDLPGLASLCGELWSPDR